MIKNSAYIFIKGENKEYDRDTIEKWLNIDQFIDNEETRDILRQKAREVFIKLNGEEPPDKFLKDAVELMVKKNQEHLLVEKYGRYYRISHSGLAFNGLDKVAAKISRNCMSYIITIADFDNSAFQLSIYQSGELRTKHQIGEELCEYNLKPICGSTKEIAAALTCDMSNVEAWIFSDDVMTVEDAVDSLLIK